MTKKIVIKSCKDCPNVARHGAWSKISYIPYCFITKQDLPFEVKIGRLVYAELVDTIPDNCPLEDNDE